MNKEEQEIIESTKEFAKAHNIHYDQMTENMILNAMREQFLLHGVGSSLPKVCKGCGTLSTKVIDKKYLACCPDNNYIDMEDYCKNSIYPEKQF